MKIQDGTGTGNEVRVDDEHRLSVAAVTATESEHNTDKGNKFNINTGDITLTSANLTTVLYIQNNSDDPLFITSIFYLLGASASGSGDAKVTINRNPTGGAIITNANDVLIKSNQNFGSSKTFTGLAYKGATGETVSSGGEPTLTTRLATHTGRYSIPVGAMILTKGSALSIDYTPASSNTSQIVQFAVACFFQDIVV